MGNIVRNAKYLSFSGSDSNVVSNADVILARESWMKIVTNSSQAFIEKKTDPDFQVTSCLAWFYDW